MFAKGKVRLYTETIAHVDQTNPEIVMIFVLGIPSQELILDGDGCSKDGKANFFQVLKRDRMKDLVIRLKR